MRPIEQSIINNSLSLVFLLHVSTSTRSSSSGRCYTKAYKYSEFCQRSCCMFRPSKGHHQGGMYKDIQVLQILSDFLLHVSTSTRSSSGRYLQRHTSTLNFAKDLRRIFDSTTDARIASVGDRSGWHILGNWNVHYRAHNNLPLVPLLINAVAPSHQISLRSILTLSSHLSLGLPGGLFASGFPTKTLYAFLLSPIHATFPACLTPHLLIWLPLLRYKSILSWKVSVAGPGIKPATGCVFFKYLFKFDTGSVYSIQRKITKLFL
jgi:hypothetical protein